MATGRIFFTGVIWVALLSASAAAADDPPPRGYEPAFAKAQLLDVPFVPQSEALCGGAAAAMVLRYWRSTPVYAEDFTSLVGDRAEGITLRDLARVLRERGWRALPFTGTSADIQNHLSQGQPVIALILDRPGRYHYVVVVAWTTHHIVYHDPARGPFRVVDLETFERAWAVTGRSAMLILPQAESVTYLEPDRQLDPTAPGRCAEPLGEAIRIARGGDLEGAEALLSFLREGCPTFGGALRELAGIRFLQKRWAEAAALAEQAVAADPCDMHAWQLLASARFVRGDVDRALYAWNRRNEPRVDLARVQGLGRTHYQIVSDALNLPSQTLLTAGDLRRAKRRIAELPALLMSHVSYSPRANGLASIDVAVLERRLIPKTWPALGAMGVRAATAREAVMDVASPTGNGELWTVSWRWWANRPRVALSVATPRLGRWNGLWRLDASWEQQTYGVSARAVSGNASESALIESTRRRVAMTFGDWQSAEFRWQVSGALENWNRDAKYVALGTAVERRFLGDTLAIRVDSTLWPGMGHANGFATGGLSSAWRSSRERTASWTASAGMQVVSAGTPFDLWPAGDTGHARGALLRAHPLLDNGVIRGSALGRVVTHGTLEFQRDLASRPFAHFRWAAFIDGLKRGMPPVGTAPAQVDLGMGLRVELPGAPGALRLDVARGLRDGNIALAAVWQPSWPAW